MILMDLFEEVLHLSIYGTVAGAGVWLLSLLIGRVRAPKWIALVLWGILAFRLVIPFSFSSKMSVYQIGDLDMRIENTLSLDRIYAEGAQNLQMGTVESPKAFAEGISLED
ncbi:MAG: M56 family metallopeptidase [Lachnospiraceae bacterium]|nr:M56 family metallopeptidase [Lachnospiraceae bacterium]